MRILVVNCNTSEETTRAIERSATAAALPGTEIVMAAPTWGVESAEGYYESFISAAAVLDVLTMRADDADAVVLAGYGEHGREGARQLLDIPVVDITEASADIASLIGHRFGVVTTLSSTLAGIGDSLLTSGDSGRCAGIRAADVPVLALHDDVESTARLLVADARALIEAGADVIVLGCAGMAGLDRALEALIPVPVIDPVSAAVGMAELLVRMGKSTSKAGPFAPPSRTKLRPGWPLTNAVVAAA